MLILEAKGFVRTLNDARANLAEGWEWHASEHNEGVSIVVEVPVHDLYWIGHFVSVLSIEQMAERSVPTLTEPASIVISRDDRAQVEWVFPVTVPT